MFQWAVDQALRAARRAADLAIAIGTGQLNEPQRLETVDTLAYHLATQYRLKGDQRDKEEALELASSLKPYSGRKWEIQETIVWVQVICNNAGTLEYEQGLDNLKALLGYRDIPHYWRQLQHEKYSRLFQLNLPAPVV